jgi:transcriptional regulator with XRE-family HTH domain
MKRFEMGITQEELAEKTDLHPTYVGSESAAKET